MPSFGPKDSLSLFASNIFVLSKPTTPTTKGATTATTTTDGEKWDKPSPFRNPFTSYEGNLAFHLWKICFD